MSRNKNAHSNYGKNFELLFLLLDEHYSTLYLHSNIDIDIHNKSFVSSFNSNAYLILNDFIFSFSFSLI